MGNKQITPKDPSKVEAADEAGGTAVRRLSLRRLRSRRMKRRNLRRSV